MTTGWDADGVGDRGRDTKQDHHQDPLSRAVAIRACLASFSPRGDRHE